MLEPGKSNDVHKPRKKCTNNLQAFPYKKKHKKINSNDLQMTLNDLQITLVAKISVPLVFTRQMAQNGPKHIHLLT